MLVCVSMHRLNISLSDATEAALRRRSDETDAPMAKIVARALERYLGTADNVSFTTNTVQTSTTGQQMQNTMQTAGLTQEPRVAAVSPEVAPKGVKSAPGRSCPLHPDAPPVKTRVGLMCGAPGCANRLD